jgi:zinc transport system substrate-binding protein
MFSIIQKFSGLKYLLAMGFVSVIPALTGSELSVWVSIEPQAYFVERVGGDHVSVKVLVRPGQSPELYAPSPRDLIAVARADAYFTIGVPVEQTITARLQARESGPLFIGPAVVALAHSHDHSVDHDHSKCLHAGTDPHTWMDPVQMIAYVDTIKAGLIALHPEMAEVFEVNAAKLLRDLENLNADLSERLQPYAGHAFYINHPSLGHFANRYDLEQRSIELAGSGPVAKRMVEIVKSARADQVRAVLTQREYGRSSAQVLAEVDILSRSYIKMMESLVQVLEVSFSNE